MILSLRLQRDEGSIRSMPLMQHNIMRKQRTWASGGTNVSHAGSSMVDLESDSKSIHLSQVRPICVHKPTREHLPPVEAFGVQMQTQGKRSDT